MTTGRPAFFGPNVLAVLTSLAVDTPTPVTTLNPTVPPALAGLIDQLLAKEPAQRPKSASAVADTLRRIEELIDLAALPAYMPPSPDPWQDIDLTEANASAVSPKSPGLTASIPVPLAEPVPDPAPPPKPNPPRKKTRPAAWKVVAVWGLLALLTFALGVVLAKRLMPKPTEVPPDDPGGDQIEPKQGPPKGSPPGVVSLPAVFVPPLDDGLSPLDNLDPAKIPASEKFAWQPKELVAVIGTHKMRHWGTIIKAVYSPKGDLVATHGTDGIRFWDAKTMAEMAILPLGSSLQSLCFSPDGRRLAVYHPTRSILIFDVAAMPPKEYGQIIAYSYDQSFTPDGKRFVVRDSDVPPNRYEFWDMTGNKPTKTKAVPNIVVGNFTYVVGNERVLDIIRRDEITRVARLIDLSSDGVVLDDLELDTPEAAVSADGKWFARSTPEGKKTVRVYDISGGKFEEKGTFDDASLATHRAHHLAFIPGTDKLCFQAGDNGYWVRDLAAGTTTVLKQDSLVTMKHVFAPGGKRITTWHENRLATFDVTDGGKVTLAASNESIGLVIPVADANRVLTWEINGPPRRWDMDVPEPKAVVVKRGVGKSMTALPDGRVLGLGPNPKSIYVHAPGRGDAADPVELPIAASAGRLMCTSRSGKWLATASGFMNERSPRLFDFRVTPPKMVGELSDYPKNHNTVGQMAFSPGEQFLLAVGGADSGLTNKTCVWDLRGAKPKLAGTYESCTYASFAVDSATLVVGYIDGRVKLLDYSTGEFKEAVSRPLFTRPVSSAILLPASKTVMACDDIGLIKFVKMPTGEAERPDWQWPGPATFTLSNDGRHVFTANANGTGYIIRLQRGPATPKP